MKRAEQILTPKGITNGEHNLACAELDSVSPIKIKIRHMKRSILITLFLAILVIYSAKSQEDVKTKKHEISIDMYNLLNPIKLSGISFSFDYLLNDSESIGLTPTYSLDENSLGVNYKHFFSKKYAQGFYTEVGATYKMGSFYTGSHYHHHNYYSCDNQLINYKALNLDLKIGYKLVSKKNYFIDVFAGITKTMFGTNPQNYKYPFTPYRFGFKIGKRF